MNFKSRFFVTALLSVLAVSAAAMPSSGRGFAFSVSEAHAASGDGTVESVRTVPLQPRMGGFESALEHAINPEMADEVVVQLDKGDAVTFLRGGSPAFTAGQRVRVHPGVGAFPSY